MTGSASRVVSPASTSAQFTVESIEQQINQAWSELGAIAEEQGAPAPLRTSILTLVVFANRDRETRRAKEVLERLVQVLPSRVILVSIDERTTVLNATVSAQCAIRGENHTGCYEMIEISASPDDLRAMPSILTQLDISDLTTFVWWVGPVNTASTEFRRISSAAERVIIDSSRFPDALSTLQEYHEFVSNQSHAVGCTDLTWSNLLTLRELVAQSFDMPAALDLLTGLRRIDIGYHPDALADALLMAGWLISRLGHRPASASQADGSVQLGSHDAEGGTLQISLEPTLTASCGLRSIRLIGHSSQHSSRVSIRRLDDSRALVNIDVTGAPRQERMVHCADGSEDQMLGMELVQFQRDRIYEEALGCAAEFARLLQNKG